LTQKILVIPDVQVKPDQDFEFLKCIGRYIVDKKPQTIVCLGDFADMPSLSEYDKGKKSFEGRMYTRDIEAAKVAMDTLLDPIREEQERLRRNKEKQYKPRMVMVLGNHENRIEKAIDNDRKLEGLLSVNDLGYEQSGWETYPYLQPVVINNIAFCHYFVSGVMGRPVTTARMLLTKHHMSCVAGHQQGRDIAYGRKADGTSMTAIISGSCYEHEESYLNHQTNVHFRGLWMLYDVQPDGSFDELPLSLKYIKKKYGDVSCEC